MTWIINGSPSLDQQSQWQAITITTLIFTTSMLLVVSLRFWIRRRILHREDWLTFGTMLFSIIYSASVILQTRYGLGLPVVLQPVQDWRKYMVINYASRPFYLLGLAGFKLALCTSYLRMTQGSNDRTYRRIIVAVANISTFSHIIFVVLYLCQCVPLSEMFNRDADGTCIPFAPLNYSISVVVILCDVTIFLLPMPLIYRLHLERSIKIGLAIAFALGLLTTVLSIMRATQIHRIAYGDGDDTYFVIRSALEMNIGIITSCLPVLRPVLRLIPRKLISLLPFPTTNKHSSASPSNVAIELPGDYPPTQSSYAGSTKRTWLNRNSMRWLEKGKAEVFYTTTPITNNNNKEMDQPEAYSPSLPSRNASTTITMSTPPLAASRPNWADHRRSATARSILSQAGTTQSLLSTTTTNEGVTQSLIQGGGRQRWEHPDGSGRWEGFGGVIRTVELEVSSEASLAPMSSTGLGEFGRGLTRKDEWEVPVRVSMGGGERG